ncbi:hypothetical protein MrNuV_ORF011 [Macrobrachium rosenbergii nudivirus]|nr:hypothetical protein MrNuV_ORF011 [Macrobrachium rosenbergii nudivirus]
MKIIYYIEGLSGIGKTTFLKEKEKEKCKVHYTDLKENVDKYEEFKNIGNNKIIGMIFMLFNMTEIMAAYTSKATVEIFDRSPICSLYYTIIKEIMIETKTQLLTYADLQDSIMKKMDIYFLRKDDQSNATSFKIMLKNILEEFPTIMCVTNNIDMVVETILARKDLEQHLANSMGYEFDEYYARRYVFVQNTVFRLACDIYTNSSYKVEIDDYAKSKELIENKFDAIKEHYKELKTFKNLTTIDFTGKKLKQKKINNFSIWNLKNILLGNITSLYYRL